MHELIQSAIQSDIISEKKFVTSGGSVPFPFREIYPTQIKTEKSGLATRD